MSVVSDTSPLRYLIATGNGDLLSYVFGALIIPSVVLSELTHSSAPLVVRTWCLALPEWISVRDPIEPPDPALVATLDPGEAGAIQLSIEINAEVLLIDERIGRSEATRRGVPVGGTLGVLREAYRRGLIADPLAAVASMQSQGFRVSKRLLLEFHASLSH